MNDVSFSTGFQPGGLAIADFNGDGHSDLTVANWDSNDVSVLLNSCD